MIREKSLRGNIVCRTVLGKYQFGEWGTRFFAAKSEELDLEVPCIPGLGEGASSLRARVVD